MPLAKPRVYWSWSRRTWVCLYVGSRIHKGQAFATWEGAIKFALCLVPRRKPVA